MKSRTYPSLALEPDPAAMHLDDLPRHRKSEPCAHDCGRWIVCAPLIAAEELVVEFRRHTDSVIFDRDQNLSRFCSAGDDDLSALRGVLDRVVEEYPKQLRKL